MGACCSCHVGGNTSGGYNKYEKRRKVEDRRPKRQITKKEVTKKEFTKKEVTKKEITKREMVKDEDTTSCDDESDLVANGDGGATIRLQGSSKFVSMYTQQGKKGVNQDAMTVWENFVGEKDTFFCGVFDGHGPNGHKVARHIRDSLPSKVTSLHKHPHINNRNYKFEEDTNSVDQNNGIEHKNNPFYSSWKDILTNSFKDMDETLECESSIDSYCSGTTAVTLVKKGNHLMVANLGDSRAVLCTRDDKDILVPVQLTVDLKPNLPSESERIKSCKGRVLAMEEEPSIFRIWMPDQDCPGLAMARAFGDFCLKDFGLISTPEIYYRKLSEKDEFVVIATDGIWDALSNIEVMKIVGSARDRSMAAKLLVERANRAWRYKYPNAKIDDCAAVCLFFKKQSPSLTKSLSEVTELSFNYSEVGANDTNIATEDGLETVLNCDVKTESKDNIANVDATVSSGGLIKRRRTKDFEYVE